MDVVNVILQPVVESLLVPVKKHIDFMTSCKKYVRDMDSSMKELNATRLDVKNHMELNKGSNLEIPAHLPSWLEEVEKVDAEVNSISTNVGSCFSFKTRHEIGKKAFKTIQRIERLTEEHSRIIWTNHPIPLGKVDSIKASTSTPSVEYHGDFESRKETFMKALKALEPDHKSHMIALCGMGGVGKTTMMEKLKTVVKEKGMFSLIIKVVIGEKTDPFAIQDAVADYLSINLKEITSIPARADKLRKWFKNYSEGGKKKILVILDDIWQLVDLNDIGLSPFPDQGVDFKVLLTSRKRDVCTRMGVESKSICNVDLLANAEAQRFFWKFVEDSDEANLDPDLRKLGDDIVSRCQGLPIAIKTIAFALKDNSKCVWEDTRIRLQHHDIDEIMNEVFELSYNNLEDEQTKSVLLLCGLYPEDFDIPTEELVRYGWGLKLFYKVNTIGQARNRLNACVVRLVNANLLIESNGAGSIKMHDLVRAFVLKMFSKAEHASIVNHGSMSEWSVNDTSDSCKRISLACKGMEDFPGDFKYPNLSFLKLTNGDKSLRFPENFYRLMEKLQVIVFEKMQYPLLPGSFEYSTNLRTLCLHECSLMFDFHSIGSLSNLEVLSFANCSIQKLPSTVGNLKELKLLDLTGCVNLHIDDGVLKNLVKLEELYMRVAHEKAISFTDGNFNELANRSKSLSAIEIELFRKNAHPKRMSFNKLERFKISVGCFLEEKDEKTTSFENTLMLVSNKGELLESRINVLFEKTDVLHLEVDDMNNLEDFKCSSFHRLRVLNISKCAQLKYLFTRRVASTLSRLEHLEVWSCDTLQTLIHDEDNGSETIRFPSLKFLSFGGLPILVGLCNTRRVIELPQLMELRLDDLPDFTSIFPDDNLASSSLSSDTSTMKPFLNEEVAIPKLETMQIRRMNKLSKIWSSEVTRSENVSFSMLKTIEVEECDMLVNVFPRNPMPLLHHLKQLSVKRCRYIKTIFTPDFNLKTLQEIDIDYGEISSIEKSPKQQLSLVESSPEQQNNAISRDIAFSSHLIHTFHQLRTLALKHDREAQVVFDIESSSSGELSTSQNNHHQLLPSLEDLTLSCMDSMSHVWKCNRNQFFILQQPKFLCQNLTKITLNQCRSIKYLFSPPMLKFLSNLKRVHIEDCEVMEEIVSNRDDEDEKMATSTSTHTNVKFSPILKSLNLICLKSLQHIGGNGGSRNSIYNQFKPKKEEEAVAFRWSLCQYSRDIYISGCSALSSAIPSYALGHMQYLKTLEIHSCDSMKEVFEIERVVVNDVKSSSSSCRPGEGSVAGDNNNNNSSSCVVSSLTNTTTTILPDLRNLRRLVISHCHLLRDVFPFSTLQSLTKLEYLRIQSCDSMKEVFEIKSSCRPGEASSAGVVSSLTNTTTTTTILPDLRNLRSLRIYFCPLLRDVFPFSTLKSLTKLEYLRISCCDDIRLIVKEDGNHTTPSSSSDDHQVVVFPCLKSLELFRLPNLESFFLGTNDFQWPVLETVEIIKCPKMRMFTKGHSDSPMLKYVVSDMGENSVVECGLNNLLQEEEVPYPSLDGSSSLPFSERMPWFYNNLIKVYVEFRGNQRFIIAHNELQHMLKIEKLRISCCSGVKEIFETSEMNNGLNQTHSVVEVREMDFGGLHDIKCLWKSKQWRVLKFPNLTRLSIDYCGGLKHVFTISMVGSLLQLQELSIRECPEMETILADVEENDEEDEKEQNDDGKEDEDDDERRVNETDKKEEQDDDERRVNEVEFPSLRLLSLHYLTSLKGFCLGIETIHWPSLDTLEIKRCPKITTFTNGQSTTPKLKLIKTSFGLCDATEGVNSFIRTKIEEGFEFAE